MPSPPNPQPFGESEGALRNITSASRGSREVGEFSGGHPPGPIIAFHPLDYQENVFQYQFLFGRYESVAQLCTRSDSTRTLKMNVSIVSTLLSEISIQDFS